ncbi:MAG TPA: aminopeptidase P family protein [Acetobacteraceae bacterium]|nr:aminopeptidase P family protein [Acetobacteraceae bacterium]
MKIKRVADFRNMLRKAGLDGFIQPRNDEYIGEYVPEASARLAWLTGFTGSAGLAVVLEDTAAVFSDGRYTLQLAAQTDPAIWERLHIMETPPHLWLKEHAPSGGRIGYDPWLMTPAAIAKYAQCGCDLVPAANPVDALWTDRPVPPASEVVPHDLAFAGEPAAEKRARIASRLSGNAGAVMLTDPHALAWLFNIRAADLPHTPIALGFALLRRDASATIFMEPARFPAATRAHLGDAVDVQPRAAMADALARLAGERVQLDPATSPIWFTQTLKQAGAVIVEADDPCVLPRAIKNPIEQDGARAAHLRDGMAMCRFLAWLADAAPRGGETELSAAAKLRGFRAQAPEFRAESFAPISGAGEHGAIIHYSADEASNRPIRPNEVYLIDSGGQYPDGTTDITRTVWTGPDTASGTPPREIAERFTRVLAGHIALATAMFPEGVAGPHLDALARAPLWQAGLDYDHGTGHGVGSYLSVHEGPVSFHRAAKPVPLAAGMILSDEPGYYQPGGYGIRLENLLLVVPGEVIGPKRFLAFETLTLAPFDRRLILPELLDAAALDWLDAYHARVLEALAPGLGVQDRAWLTEACAPLA